MKEKYQLTEKELVKIKQEFESFKSSAKVLEKGVWSKITKNKIFDLLVKLSKTKEVKDLLVSGVKKYLES